jgi:hypothetical protein
LQNVSWLRLWLDGKLFRCSWCGHHSLNPGAIQNEIVNGKKYAFCTPKRGNAICKERFTEFKMELDMGYMIFKYNNEWNKIIAEEIETWGRLMSEID